LQNSFLQINCAYYGDYNELLYLRARQYMPSMGRFLTGDTWSGNPNIPMSFNKWNYVGGNPVNLTDPSGNFPPIWCQMMPNKATYELCIDQHYDIEPISYFALGANVEGEWGCYSGPTQYRAPGYIEGLGLTITPSIVNWLFAIETVYDFATMEQQVFINDYVPGLGLSDVAGGISVAKYAGAVYGLRSDRSINFTYPGPVFQYYNGVSGGIELFQTAGLGVGIGKTRFVSLIDLRVRGETWFISGSFGVDVPIVDVGGGIMSLAPLTKVSNNYLNPKDSNKVEWFRLYSDILFGRNSIWGYPSNPFGSNNIPIDWAARILAANNALKYAAVYEDLHK